MGCCVNRETQKESYIPEDLNISLDSIAFKTLTPPSYKNATTTTSARSKFMVLDKLLFIKLENGTIQPLVDPCFREEFGSPPFFRSLATTARENICSL